MVFCSGKHRGACRTPQENMVYILPASLDLTGIKSKKSVRTIQLQGQKKNESCGENMDKNVDRSSLICIGPSTGSQDLQED